MVPSFLTYIPAQNVFVLLLLIITRERETDRDRRIIITMTIATDAFTEKKKKRSSVSRKSGKVHSNFFFFFISTFLLYLTTITLTATAFESPAKTSLSAYEIVTFSKVETTTGGRSSSSSSSDGERITAVEFTAFKLHFRVLVEPSSSKFLKNGDLFVDALNGNQKSVNWQLTNEVEREKTCFYDGKTVVSTSSSSSAKNANNIASGNLCPGAHAHLNVVAKNASISLAMPHADFATDVAQEKMRRRRRALLQNDDDDESNATGDKSSLSRQLRSTYFIAFRAEDELDSNIDGTRFDKVVYKPSSTDAADHGHKKRMRRSLQQASDWTAKLETYVIIDKKRSEDYINAGKTDLDCVMDSLAVMNFVNALYEDVFDVELDVVVSGFGIFSANQGNTVSSGNLGTDEPWTYYTLATGDCDYCETDEEVDSGMFLGNVSDWGYLQIEADAKFFNGADDISVLSGHDFDGGTIGLAYMSQICGTWPYNINEVRYTNTLRYSAATVAHEIGHNLGFPHDGQDDYGTADCPPAGLIMAAMAGRELETQWSTCSIDVYNDVIEDMKSCLTQGNSNVCGNGIIEEGEECDCYGKDCTNTLYYGANEQNCCDASTCKLKTGKSCSSYHDGCCTDECTIAAKDVVCRAASEGGCDVAETCDGASKSCDSRDYWKPYGTICTVDSSTGGCYKNECRIGYPQRENEPCYLEGYYGVEYYESSKGSPCSDTPTDTISGVFSKVCDGTGACISPAMLDYDNGAITNTQMCDASESIPANGSIGDCDELFSHGKTCTFSCKSGYTLSGTTSCSAGKIVSTAVCNLDSIAAIEASLELSGYSVATFLDAQKTAFVEGMASYLAVEVNRITITDITDVVFSGAQTRRKLTETTNAVQIDFKVGTTAFDALADVESKLVTEDATNLIAALDGQAGLTVSATSIKAPTTVVKLAPPPSPPPSPPPVSSLISPAVPRAFSSERQKTFYFFALQIVCCVLLAMA